MVRALTIARVELVRLLRDRANIFFVFVFPLLLVVLIGAGFGGSMEQRIGMVAPDDLAADRLVGHLEEGRRVTVVRVGDVDELTQRVERGGLAAGIVLPSDFGRAVAGARDVDVGFVARPDGTSQALRVLVEDAVAGEAATIAAARTAAAVVGGEASQLVALAAEQRTDLGGVEVRTEQVGADELAQEFAGLGQFDLGASSQLFLFTFLTAITASASLIQTRRLGVAQRMLATPTSVSTLLVGQAGGRVLVALLQAAYIVVATLLLFRVDWGDPVATGAVVLLFCVLSGAAGMLIGATMRNDSQAGSVGVGLGLGFAALGGSMVPLEVFPDAMRRVAMITPHAWANDAMAEIVRRDAGVLDVLGQLGVLAGFATGLLALAAWRLRRLLATGA